MVQTKNVTPADLLAAAPTRVSPRAAGPAYTFRSVVGDRTVEIGVQSHAEFAAFVNWLYSERPVPLEPVEADHPRVF